MGRERTGGGGARPIGTARAALTVLVVGGTALGALLLRPDTDLLAKGRGPLGGNSLLVIGLALLALLGGLALRDGYQGRMGTARRLNPVERRAAEGVSRVLPIAALAVPLLILVLHRFGSSGGGHGDEEPSPLPSRRDDTVRGLHPARHPGHAEHSTHFGLTRILLGLGIALLLVVLVVAGLRLWRHLTRPSALGTAATYTTLEDEEKRLAQAVDSGRRALRDGTDARAAVIAAYAAMEESLADSGVTRRAADSPQDLLRRAVAGGLPAGAAAATLTALFREARYSTHPMHAGHRERAAAALAEIAEGLRSRKPGHEAATDAS
ncbi:DUF4129 domain-containing protein [Streptomyces griseoaurantiacus]|uniref:DUF4129 domain-containing protein n=1 Tax=Streptomyces griseoaurantiacus TaxID=68213 RepID=UPI003F1AF08E